MNWRPLVRLLILLAIPLWLMQCTGNSTQTGGVTAESGSLGSARQQATESTVAASSASASASAGSSADSLAADYRISPRDILDISVFQVPDLNRSVQVSDDGSVVLPLVGIVQVKGKTAHDASTIIADRLSKKYLQSPQVSVFVKQYGQKVVVNGEVKSPRVLAVEGNLTLSQAVAYAGGLSELADSRRVHIARSANGQVHDEVYDLNQIQSGAVPDPSLQGGDLVVVEQSGTQVAIKSLKDMLPFAIFATIF